MKTASRKESTSDSLLTYHQVTQSSAQVARSVLAEVRRSGLPLPPELAFYAHLAIALAKRDNVLMDIQQGKAFYHTYPSSGQTRLVYRKRTPRRKQSDTVLCGAKTRKGTPCQCLPEEGKRRCRFHGGKSTGPKTEAGRAAIAESNRRRAKQTRIDTRRP